MSKHKGNKATVVETPQAPALPVVETPQAPALPVQDTSIKGRTYGFRAFHSRNLPMCTYGIAGVRGVVFFPVHHIQGVVDSTGRVTMPPTMELAAIETPVEGHTLVYRSTMACGRPTYAVAGLKGTWTLHATMVPATADGSFPALLWCSLPLAVAAKVPQPTATTDAAIAAANVQHEATTGELVTPSGIAGVQSALGDKAVA